MSISESASKASMLTACTPYFSAWAWAASGRRSATDFIFTSAERAAPVR